MQAGPPPDDLLEPKPKASAKRPTSSRPTSTRSLEREIGEALVVANIFASPFLREDALDDAEIFALAKAMNEQAKKSARFRRLVEGALNVTGAGGLIGVIAMIAGRRFARHGVIPPVWDLQLGMMLRIQAGQISPEDSAAMEAAMAMMAEQTAAQAQQEQTQSAPESTGPTIATPITPTA